MQYIVTGDVVSTSTHAYKMTVHSIKDGKAICNYFDKNNQLHTEEYHLEEIEFVSH